MKILIIVAHPDDEVLGMGGTIKKHTNNGDDVELMILSTGIYARKKNVELMKKELRELREDAKKAAQILGIKRIRFYGYADNEMDKETLLTFVQEVEKVLEEFKPEIVYTQHHHDINIDHQLTFKATLCATRPIKGGCVKKLLCFEVPSSTEWNYPYNFKPNIFIDITKELKFKLEAIKQYKGEIREYPHPRSIKGLTAYAQRWGTLAGFEAAEAFELIREKIE